MSPLERIQGINAELAAVLSELGVHEITDLATADASRLAKGLEIVGRKRGRSKEMPGIISVKLLIKAAQEKIKEAPVALELEEIPEAEIDQSEADIPEAIIDPLPVPVSTSVPPKAATPTRAASPSQSFGSKDPGPWQGVQPSRFQTLEDYAEGGRGIEPLKRNHHSKESAPAKLSQTKGQGLSRWTRRGVLYPFPLKAICGSLVAILWRLSLLATCIGLPYYTLTAQDGDAPPVIGSLLWLGILAVLGIMHIWYITHTRCRVCSCHLFYSKRCFKNSRAHLIQGLGYVLSLAVHMIMFQWFRCMYCGTAIRLFGGSARHSEPSAESVES